MRILYPENPLNSKAADDPYQPEYASLLAQGMACSLFDFDALGTGEFSPRPRIQPGERVLYRGWMLNPASYATLVRSIENLGAQPITSVDAYTRCHHLPGWYAACSALTAETHFFAPDADIQAAAAQLGWASFFVKDFVKSNTGDQGSIARSPAAIPDILAQLKLYRGDIEGGIALRRVENYAPQSEQRYFVANQTAYGLSGEVPHIVKTVAETIQAPFFSVDIVQTAQGAPRVVELGDGQVSDKKQWPLDRFTQVLLALV